LTAAELCDVVYTLNVERLERWAIASQGGMDVYEKAKRAYDLALIEEPEAVAPERRVLLDALGVSRAR